MAVEKTDWKRHASIYAERHAPNGVSIAEYAEQNGLNKNTARRYLRSRDTTRDQQRDHSIDHCGDHVVDHASDHVQAKRGKSAKPRAGKASRGAGGGGAGAAKGARKAKSEKTESGDHSDDHLIIPTGRTQLKRPRVTVPLEVMRRVRGTGTKPNSQPITHGGYAEAPDHLWDAALTIPEEEIDFWNVRGAMVSLMNIATNRQAVFDYYASMDAPSSGNDQPKAPKEVQLLKTACSGIDLEVMLRGFIQKQQQQDYQNEIRRAELEIKLAERQKKEVIEKQVLAILVRRDKEEMTASYACRLIERIGGVVPQTLLREFDYELKTPKVDENAGANFKDFEADVEAYYAEQRAAEGYVTQRREEVMQLVDKMGMGDDSTDNASMLSIALQDDDDGEEWESEEESAIYAPDFGVDDDIDDDDDEDGE